MLAELKLALTQQAAAETFTQRDLERRIGATAPGSSGS